MSDEYKPMDAKTLKKRGRCCKSACLHCPYGHTLKKVGLKFKKVEDISQLDDPFKMELGSEKESCHWVILKDHECALIKVNHLFVLDIRYVEGFEDQGLDKEVIESYFFY